jgi:TldD protein
MRRIAVLSLSTILIAAAAAQDADLKRELEQDVVLRAMVDELARNQAKLELEDLERPYFIEYALVDMCGAYVSATLGAVDSHNEHRGRSLRTDVRVGSYELDNTNFGGGYGGYWGSYGGYSGGAAIPIEDDYNAIRQAIWWTSDRDYKNVVETFVKKKAFMESKLIKDKPDDFSRETPAVYFEERLQPSVDKQSLRELALRLSEIFREHPEVQESGAHASGGGGNEYLVNTEGTRIRCSDMHFSVSCSATVQADDGMKLSDSFTVYARALEDLPPLEQLVQRCRKMVARLIEVKNAPMMEEPYTGPVLFEAEPAASIFSGEFESSFPGGQPTVGSGRSVDDFANKLNRRILPRFVQVVDDPTLETIANQPVLGHYVYDDQGVKARRVTLVEGGRLKAQLMSRNPSKEFAQSTGHGRGFYGASASIGCLIVTADPSSDADELRQELIEACQDEGLEYGIRIASVGGYGSAPLEMYKVYPDGREELVRGAQIADIDLKSFKRMLAVGDTPYVLNSGGMFGGETIVAPALLFEELDLAKIDRDFDKPPILPSPLAREGRAE